MLKKLLEPSNSGALMRGPRRRRVPCFEVVRPSVSIQGTSRFPFKRVTVWWTRAPFFDLLTSKEGRKVTGLFRPVEGVPSRQRFQFRLDRTLASRVYKTVRRTHSNKWQVGFFQKHPRGPTLDTVAPGAPPSEPPKARGPRAREKSGASCTKSLSLPS